MRRVVKIVSLICVIGFTLQLTACSQSPLRNPFKGRPTVKVGPLPEVTNDVPAQVVWQQKETAGSSYYSKVTPDIRGQVIYQASHEGDVVALQKGSGKTLWKKRTGLPVASGPKVFGNQLFVGTKDARVVALDANNGQTLWQAQVTSEVLSPVQANDNVVLVNSIDGQLTALDFKSGKKLWSYEKTVPALTLRGGSSPVLSGDQALAGFANGKFVALSLKNGSMAWEKTISAPRGRSEIHRLVDIHATPIVAGNDVYVVTYQGNMMAIDLRSGQVQWQRQVASYRDLEIDDQALYMTDKEHQVIAIDRNTGSTLWKQAGLDKRLITGPAATSDYLVVGDYGGYVHWLKKSDGSLVGSKSLGRKILQSPVSEGDMVFVTSDNGKLTALRLPKGGA